MLKYSKGFICIYFHYVWVIFKLVDNSLFLNAMHFNFIIVIWSANLYHLDPQYLSEFLNLISNMSNTNGTMVRRSLFRPFVHKLFSSG
jgi:hypothetical protein